MRISDWRSDVCSSDLPEQLERQRAIIAEVERLRQRERLGIPRHRARAGEGACLGIDQRRGGQMFGERRVALKEERTMSLARTGTAGYRKSNEDATRVTARVDRGGRVI